MFSGGGGTETDPIVGAITGIVKADGGGSISAASAGTDYQAASAALASIAGLSEADVSVLQCTADNTYAVLTSGGNNYILGSNSSNAALEFKTPANVLSQIGAQGVLTNEAGLYAALSDVSDFVQMVEVTAGTLNLATTGTINGTIKSTVLTTCEGTDDSGTTNQAFLTDSGESWPTNAYVGMTLYNITDGSSTTVTANDGTTMTGTLAGGSENDWDNGDSWAVAPGPYQSGSIFYIGSATTILHPATAGYVACYYSTAANTIKVDPQSGSMQFTLNGTPTGTNGEELDSAGAAGDYICIHNQSATIGITLGRSGSWSDGGSS